MSDRITSLSEIQDEKKFLDAYYGLKKDVEDLRSSVKAMEKEKSELEKQLEGLSEEAVSKFKEKAIRQEIRSKLVEDGVPNPDGVLKYLDLNGVDYDEDDNLTGVDDKLDALKTDLPLLFDKKARAGRSSVDIHADKPAKAEKTTTEAQVDSLFAV